MSLLTPQQSRTNGPSDQEMTSLDSSESVYSCTHWQDSDIDENVDEKTER